MTNEEIIKSLNELLANEMLATEIYTVAGIHLEHLGIKKMAEIFFKEALEEMEHTKKLGARIAFLGGAVKVHKNKEIKSAENIEEMIKSSLKMEEKAAECYKKAIELCERNLDFVTADLLHAILAEEEEHIDFFQKELRILEQIGLQNYIFKNS